MKRPKTFETKYLTSKVAAAQLRDLADHIENCSDFACWNTNVSIWRKAWDDPDFHEGIMVRAGFASKKGR